MCFNGVPVKSQSGVRARAAPLLVLGAVVLCFAAQFLFTGELFTRRNDTTAGPVQPRQAVGLVLLAAAAALAVLADGRTSAKASPESPCGAAPAFPGRVRVPVFLSLGLSLGCLLAVLFPGETSLVRGAWVAGMLLFFVPLCVGPREGLERPAIPWQEAALVAAVTGVGFWLRYERLTELPSNIHPDVALMGRVTLDMIRSGDARWFGVAVTQHPLSSHQILAAGMRLFGTDHFGLVMPSVLAGTATIPVVYLLGRELFGRTAALLGAAMLAMNYTHIHFSRTLFGPIATFLVTVGVYFLVRGLTSGVPAWYGLAGGFLAGAMFTYYSARISPLLAGAALLVEAVRGRAGGTAARKRWGALLAGGFVVFAPMLGFALRHPGEFAGRGSVVTLLDPEVRRHSMEKYDADSMGEVLLDQTWRTALGFHLFGDESPHFTFRRPAVGAATAALLVLGVGFSVRRLRSTPVVVVWAWLGLTLLLGGVLTSDPPYWPHLNILLPAVAVLAGLGGERVAAALAGGRPGLRTAASLLVGGLVVAAGVHGWRIYNAFESDSAAPAMRASRYLRRLPRETRVYVVSDDFGWDDDVFRFFNQGMEGEDESVERLLKPELRIDPPAVILLEDGQEALPRIAELRPGGRVRELRQPGVPEPVMLAYELLHASAPVVSAAR